MSKPRPRLGKGLSAILGERRPAATEPHHSEPAALPPSTNPPSEPPANTVRSLPINAIVPNRHQPRSHFAEDALGELSASIREHGLIQPVVVRKTADGAFELIVGERRWRAAQSAGLTEIPALVRDAADPESLELALIENLQREDLNPIERAAAYQHYLDSFGTNVERLAERLGESRSNVANYLRLLKLPAEIQEFVRSRQLGMGQARAIAGVTDPQRQLALARLAVRRNLSARQVEELAKGGDEPREPAPKREADANTESVERALRKALGTTVRLLPGRKKNSGRIVIRYDNLEEFDRVAQCICGTTVLE